MKCLLTTLFAVVFFSSLVTSAFAEGTSGFERRLRGTYAFSGPESCSEVPGPLGFGPPPELRIPPPAIAISYTVQSQGTITFDGTGNATSAATWANILPGVLDITSSLNPHRPIASPFDQPVGVGSNTCDWTYSVTPGNSFTMEGNCVTQHLAGAAGPTRDEVGPIQLTGFISLGGNVLIAASTTPSSELAESGGETIIRYFDGAEVYRARRLCVRGSTYLRAPKSRNKAGSDGAEFAIDGNLDPRPWW
jgi:hypothetical protein